MRLLLIFQITFLSIAQLQAQIEQTDSLANKDEELVFVNPDVPPEFPGGYDSLYAFIERNNNWRVGQETIVGKVFVEFIVEKDGTVTNIKVIKGLNESCDIEAKRLISILPKFKSGEQSGIPVKMRMVLPITFDGLK